MKKKVEYIKRGSVRIRNMAGKAQTIHMATEAWFYENPNSIDVYIQGTNVVCAARIKRSELVDWIKRTAKRRTP